MSHTFRGFHDAKKINETKQSEKHECMDKNKNKIKMLDGAIYAILKCQLVVVFFLDNMPGLHG